MYDNSELSCWNFTRGVRAHSHWVIDVWCWMSLNVYSTTEINTTHLLPMSQSQKQSLSVNGPLMGVYELSIVRHRNKYRFANRSRIWSLTLLFAVFWSCSCVYHVLNSVCYQLLQATLNVTLQLRFRKVTSRKRKANGSNATNLATAFRGSKTRMGSTTETGSTTRKRRNNTTFTLPAQCQWGHSVIRCYQVVSSAWWESARKACCGICNYRIERARVRNVINWFQRFKHNCWEIYNIYAWGLWTDLSVQDTETTCNSMELGNLSYYWTLPTKCGDHHQWQKFSRKLCAETF